MVLFPAGSVTVTAIRPLFIWKAFVVQLEIEPLSHQAPHRPNPKNSMPVRTLVYDKKKLREHGYRRTLG
jgi:hypothetical protein